MNGPSDSPIPGAADAETLRRDANRRRAIPPAIGLAVVAGLGLLSAAGSLLANAVQRAALQEQIASTPEQHRWMMELMLGTGVWIVHGWALVMSSIALVGAISMMRGRSRGLGIVASIAVMLIPSCCCCVAGIGVGVWALVVLMNAEVADAFAHP